MSEIELRRETMLNPATDSWMSVSDDVARLAHNIAHTEFVPAGLRGKDGAKVAAAILTGRELGLAPMTALASIHVINGKPGISAEMMRALVLAAGHEIVVSEVGTQRVVIKGRREGTTEWTTVAWSDADAKRAGLSGGNYSKYPRQMLTARATTELCRLIFADVIHGLRSIEELDELGPEEVVVGEVPAEDETPAATPPAKKTVSRKRTVKVQPVDQETEAAGEPPTEPRERRRPPVTRRGTKDPDPTPVQGQAGTDAGEASEPEGTAVDQAAVPAGEDDIVDAEIVEDDPAPVEVVADAEPRLTPKQRNLILKRFDDLEVTDRTERLWTSSQIVGRELGSANDMTRSEAGHLIDALARCQSRGDLELVLEQVQASDGGQS